MEGRCNLVTTEGGAGMPDGGETPDGETGRQGDGETPLRASAPPPLPISVQQLSASELTPGRTSSLVPYLRLTRELAGVLMPVSPSPEFREQLRISLVAAARQQQAQRILFRPGPAASLKDSAGAKPAAYPPGITGRPGVKELGVALPQQIIEARSGMGRAGDPVPFGAVAAYVQSERSGHRWVWGAAALGSAAVSLSLVGVVAYVVRHRHREAA